MSWPLRKVWNNKTLHPLRGLAIKSISVRLLILVLGQTHPNLWLVLKGYVGDSELSPGQAYFPHGQATCGGFSAGTCALDWGLIGLDISRRFLQCNADGGPAVYPSAHD
jgi:hypothetical protein